MDALRPVSPPMEGAAAASPSSAASPSVATTAGGGSPLFDPSSRYYKAFESIVAALTAFEADRVNAAKVAKEEKEEAERREKENKEEERIAAEEAEKRRKEEEEAAQKAAGEGTADSGEGESGREASPAPAAPPTADTPKEKKAPTTSLFSALGTPAPSPSHPDERKAAAVEDPHSPSCYKATASKVIVKALRELFEGCLVPTEAHKAAPYAPWVAQLFLTHATSAGGITAVDGEGNGNGDGGADEKEEVAAAASSSAAASPPLPTIVEDHNVALYSVCFINSTCLHAGSLDWVVDGDLLYRYVLLAARHHRRQRKIIHVCFSGVVNLCHVPKLSGPSTIKPIELVEYLAPQHAEARVVEAWCMAVTNVCLRFPALIKGFCEAGAVSMLERLLLLFGDDPKILNRGLTLLAIFTQHTVAAE